MTTPTEDPRPSSDGGARRSRWAWAIGAAAAAVLLVVAVAVALPALRGSADADARPVNTPSPSATKGAGAPSCTDQRAAFTFAAPNRLLLLPTAPAADAPLPVAGAVPGGIAAHRSLEVSDVSATAALVGTSPNDDFINSLGVLHTLSLVDTRTGQVAWTQSVSPQGASEYVSVSPQSGAQVVTGTISPDANGLVSRQLSDGQRVSFAPIAMAVGQVPASTIETVLPYEGVAASASSDVVILTDAAGVSAASPTDLATRLWSVPAPAADVVVSRFGDIVLVGDDAFDARTGRSLGWAASASVGSRTDTVSEGPSSWLNLGGAPLLAGPGRTDHSAGRHHHRRRLRVTDRRLLRADDQRWRMGTGAF